MSAWPEAVWVSKKIKNAINEAFNITEIVNNNNALVDPINAQISTVEGAVAQANTATQDARAEIITAAGELSDLQTQLHTIEDKIQDIEDELTGTEGVDTAINNLANQIDKEMVVIATNTGTSAEPSPYDIGTDVGEHSIFLILTNS